MTGMPLSVARGPHLTVTPVPAEPGQTDLRRPAAAPALTPGRSAMNSPPPCPVGGVLTVGRAAGELPGGGPWLQARPLAGLPERRAARPPPAARPGSHADVTVTESGGCGTFPAGCDSKADGKIRHVTDSQRGPYGARERAVLAGLDAQLRAADPTVHARGTELADLLRQQLPDLDDTIIGRVLVALTGESSVLASLVRQQQDPRAVAVVSGLWGTLAAAGLDMTAAAWQPQHRQL